MLGTFLVALLIANRYIAKECTGPVYLGTVYLDPRHPPICIVTLKGMQLSLNVALIYLSMRVNFY